VGAEGSSLAAIVSHAAWDLVHAELGEGYPRSLAASRMIEALESEGLGVEEALALTLLHILAAHGDTLVYAKFGGRAYQRLLAEARAARLNAARRGARAALEGLDWLWRPRGWNPGAALDILATAISLRELRRATAEGVACGEGRSLR
jgi:triphosphoribosyl-dephospho-CoA synthetase